VVLTASATASPASSLILSRSTGTTSRIAKFAVILADSAALRGCGTAEKDRGLSRRTGLGLTGFISSPYEHSRAHDEI
jgi:hypothetical protein